MEEETKINEPEDCQYMYYDHNPDENQESRSLTILGSVVILLGIILCILFFLSSCTVSMQNVSVHRKTPEMIDNEMKSDITLKSDLLWSESHD